MECCKKPPQPAIAASDDLLSYFLLYEPPDSPRDSSWMLAVRGVFKEAYSVLSSLLTTAAAEMIVQIYLARLGPEALSAGQWINNFKLLQNSFSAVLYALYPMLGGIIGKLFELTEKNSSYQIIQHQQKLFYTTIRHAIYCASLASLILAIPFWFSGSILVNWFRQDVAIARAAERFLRYYVLGLPAYSIGAALRPALATSGKRSWSAGINLAGLPLMWLLSAGLSEGLLGLPKIGIEGLAIAMAARNWFNFLMVAGVMLFSKPIDSMVYKSNQKKELAGLELKRVFDFRRDNWRDVRSGIRDLLSEGLPLSGRLLVEWASGFFTGVSYGLLDRRLVQINSAISAVLNFVLLPSMAFSNTASQLVRTDWGRGKQEEAFKFGKICILLSFCWAGLAALTLPWFSFGLIGILAKSSELHSQEFLRYLTPLFGLNLLSQCFDSVRLCSSGVSQGVRDLKKPFFISAVGMGLGVLISYLTGVRFRLGPYGVVLGSNVGTFLSGAGCLIACYQLIKKKIQRSKTTVNGSPVSYSQTCREVSMANMVNMADSEQKERVSVTSLL